jgi:hypothetical protein
MTYADGAGELTAKLLKLGLRHPMARKPLMHDYICFETLEVGSSSVTGRRLSIPLLRYPIAEHLLLYGVGARPPPDGVR